jgi:hypothetical protein
VKNAERFKLREERVWVGDDKSQPRGLHLVVVLELHVQLELVAAEAGIWLIPLKM